MFRCLLVSATGWTPDCAHYPANCETRQHYQLFDYSTSETDNETSGAMLPNSTYSPQQVQNQPPPDLIGDPMAPDSLSDVSIKSCLPQLFSDHETTRSPSPHVSANLMGHMSCEGLLEDLPRMLREMKSHEAARNEVVGVLHRVATAMERAAELLRTHLRVPALFVFPP